MQMEQLQQRHDQFMKWSLTGEQNICMKSSDGAIVGNCLQKGIRARMFIGRSTRLTLRPRSGFVTPARNIRYAFRLPKGNSIHTSFLKASGLLLMSTKRIGCA